MVDGGSGLTKWRAALAARRIFYYQPKSHVTKNHGPGTKLCMFKQVAVSIFILVTVLD